MLTVQIEGLDRIIDGLSNASRKQVAFASASALTKTAKKAETRLQQNMRAALDNPASWVWSKGTFVKPAKKTELVATVGIKDRQALYVKEHFNAGLRGQKPYEKRLSSMGVLPPGYKTIPGLSMKLDANGIPNRKHLSEIFSSLKSRIGVYKKYKVTKSQQVPQHLIGYFVVKPGVGSRLEPGIYWRNSTARAISPVLVFVRAAGYRKRLDLKRITAPVVSEFNAIFSKTLREALATAK